MRERMPLRRVGRPIPARPYSLQPVIESLLLLRRLQFLLLLALFRHRPVRFSRRRWRRIADPL